MTKLEAQLKGSVGGGGREEKFGQNLHEFKRIVQFLVPLRMKFEGKKALLPVLVMFSHATTTLYPVLEVLAFIDTHRQLG